MTSLLFPWGVLSLIGVGTGIVGSVTGAGGGFLLVPILLVAYPGDSVQAITSISLAVVAVNAFSSTVAFARLGRIDWKAGSVFAAASVPTAVLGALATKVLPRGSFDIGFGIFLCALAFYLAFRARATEGARRPTEVNIPKGAVLSGAIGFFSSLLGIGGGFIQGPMLTQLLGYPVQVATATSQYILTFMAVTGTITHVLSGEFETGIRRTIALGIGVMIGAQVGARLSSRVSGGWVLKALAFGLLLAGLRLIIGFMSG